MAPTKPSLGLEGCIHEPRHLDPDLPRRVCCGVLGWGGAAGFAAKDEGVAVSKPTKKIKPRFEALLRAHLEDKHDRAEKHWITSTPAGRVMLGARQPMLLPGVARERR
jgi:hypothetical protein